MATIFTPQNPSPRNEVRDMLLAQNFTVTIDGVKCTDYQIRIYKVSDNSLVHDTTKLTLSPNLANGQTLTHTVVGGTISNTGTDSYKWTIQVWNGAETVTSREFQFFAKTTPVLTFAPPATITSQSYEFTGTLAQAQGDLVNTYTLELYDNTQTFIESSGLITNFNIVHTFEGFTNGDNLYVRVFGVTTGRQTFDSGIVAFTVSYSQPSVNLKPDVAVDNETSLVTVSRGEVVQIIGSGSGDLSYTDDFLYTGNTALSLGNASATASFSLSIPLDFTLSFKWKPLSNTFTGKIIELGSDDYVLGYDLGRFYYTVNGIINYSNPIEIYGSVFYIVLLPQSISIAKTGLFTQLSSLGGTVLGDLSGTTLEDISLL